MSRKRQSGSRSKSNRSTPLPPAAISSRRRWCFRVIALLIPLVILAGVELGLRLASYGYPTSFFLHFKDDGRDMLASNPRFGWRFFPPAIARAPTPIYLSARKAPDTVRVFVFGESAAMGDPAPAYGFARQLEQLLRARHPEKKIEVINVAMTAINSHVIRQIARDCAPRQGDFWLIYAGNNEVIGPFGAGTIFGQQSPRLSTVRTILALKTERIGQLLEQMTRPANEPKEWAGLEFFLKWQIPADSPRLARVYDSYAVNLKDVAAIGQRSGATVVLSTMAVNLRDFPPLASAHRDGLRPEQLAEWQQYFASGKEAQAKGDAAQALTAFRRAGEIDDQFAELIFQRARCELELKQGAAEADFRLARDLDTLRFRTDSMLNEIVRETAKAKNASLIDADTTLAPKDGPDLFYDHVHLNFAGNYRLAILFATELEQHWSGAPLSNSSWLPENEVARRLAWTEFDQHRVGEEIQARLQQAPFSTQSNFRERDDAWGAFLSGSAPLLACVSNYQAAVAASPADWLLHANFARVLEAAGDNTNALKQWTETSRLLPHSAEGWANMARLTRLNGDTAAAKKFIAEALKQQPYSVEALTESGILHTSLGENETARREFRLALKWQPGFASARVNLGLLLAHEGNVNGAVAEYRETLRWRTNNVEARINLANLLSEHNQKSEAMVLYEQAIAVEPRNAIARYNFGRLLESENRAAEAITNLQIAVEQQPNVGEIHLELGNALASLGREPEAFHEFAEAVRLQPGLADAHLNYGVGLARLGRYAEAVAEFRAVLQLRPQDDRAQRMLSQAERLAPKNGAIH
jgi:tetratricopeptide (TPR) repeat protein